MTIENILDDIYPLTESVKSSIVEKEFWLRKRERLQIMIEILLQQNKAGQLLNFPPMEISVNFKELMKRINN